MSGGRNIGYVMELAEHRGSTSHCTLKRTTSLERTHYLHLQERERTTSYTYFRARKRKKERAERGENMLVILHPVGENKAMLPLCT